MQTILTPKVLKTINLVPRAFYRLIFDIGRCPTYIKKRQKTLGTSLKNDKRIIEKIPKIRVSFTKKLKDISHSWTIWRFTTLKPVFSGGEKLGEKVCRNFAPAQIFSCQKFSFRINSFFTYILTLFLCFVLEKSFLSIDIIF